MTAVLLPFKFCYEVASWGFSYNLTASVVSKCVACLPPETIKSILLQCLCGCKALSLQSRAYSIPDKGSTFITWCCASQMRVQLCSAIYHPRSVSSHRGREDLGWVYALSSYHLFLKSTRFSITVVCCILRQEKQTSTEWLCFLRNQASVWGFCICTYCILCKILASR